MKLPLLQVNISSLDIFSPKSTLGALSNRPSTNPAVDIISMEEDDGLFSGDVVLPVRFNSYNQFLKIVKTLQRY